MKPWFGNEFEVALVVKTEAAKTLDQQCDEKKRNMTKTKSEASFSWSILQNGNKDEAEDNFTKLRVESKYGENDLIKSINTLQFRATPLP